LLENGARLVPKEELLDAVWGHRFVTPGTLNSRIKDARRAVGDDGSAQRIIRTVRGRGFRLVAEVEVVEGDGAEGEAAERELAAGEVAAPEATEPGSAVSAPPALHLVARGDELARLSEHFRAACAGARRVVFLTGEPGIGKTALADGFVARIAGSTR